MGGELAALRCDLEDFAAEVFEPFSRAEQRRWRTVYLRGLLLDGRRKSVEPMAARLGEDGNRRALAHFSTPALRARSPTASKREKALAYRSAGTC
jgi:SRSO17 transposase